MELVQIRYQETDTLVDVIAVPDEIIYGYTRGVDVDSIDWFINGYAYTVPIMHDEKYMTFDGKMWRFPINGRGLVQWLNEHIVPKSAPRAALLQEAVPESPDFWTSEMSFYDQEFPEVIPEFPENREDYEKI